VIVLNILNAMSDLKIIVHLYKLFIHATEQ